jgi:hypothetical protein
MVVARGRRPSTCMIVVLKAQSYEDSGLRPQKVMEAKSDLDCIWNSVVLSNQAILRLKILRVAEIQRNARKAAKL